MWMSKTAQFVAFSVVVALAVAEPPAAYGPPGLASRARPQFGHGQFRNLQQVGHYDGFQGRFGGGEYQQGAFFGGFQRGFQGDYQSGYRSGGYQGGYKTGGYQGGYDQGVPQPFNFKYEVRDGPSGNDYSHHASSDGRSVQGEYQVLLPDGRRQIVVYTADDGGYNADVRYEGQAQYPQTGGYGGYPKGGYSGHRGFAQQGGYSHQGGFKGYTY